MLEKYRIMIDYFICIHLLRVSYNFCAHYQWSKKIENCILRIVYNIIKTSTLPERKS